MFHRVAATKGCNRCALSYTFVAGKFIREAVDNLRPSNRYLSNQGKIAGEGSKHLNETAPSAKRGPVSWTNLSLVAVASAAAVGYFKVQRERRLEEAVGKIVTTGKPAIGGPWTLIDTETKQLVSEKSFAGKFTLLYFGFARCPDICPSEMVKVGKIMDDLKKKNPDMAKNLVPIFVTIDPARDSIKNLREYAKDFHPEYVFLTGTPGQIKQMTKSYRVYVSKADETEDGDYLVDHSIVLYLHDTTGKMLDVCTQSMKPSDVVERIVESMEETVAAS